jgi:hypothetical protein
MQRQKQKQLDKVHKITTKELQMTCQQGDILLTRRRAEVMAGVLSHIQILHGIQATAFGAIHDRSKRVSGWNQAYVVVRRSDGGEPLVMSVFSDGVEVVSLELWLKEHTQAHVIALRSMRTPRRADSDVLNTCLSQALGSLFAAVERTGGSGYRTGEEKGLHVQLRWAMLAKLPGPPPDDRGDATTSEDPEAAQFGWLSNYVQRLKAILHEPADGMRTAAKREFYMLDVDDSHSLDMLEMCDLLSRLHMMSGEHIPTDRELRDEVVKIWDDLGKDHEVPLEFPEFETFFREKTIKMKKIDFQHDVIGIASGELLAALLQEAGALQHKDAGSALEQGSEKVDISLDKAPPATAIAAPPVAAASTHYTATSFSSSAAYSGDITAIFQPGFDLEKEVLVIVGESEAEEEEL